MLVLVTFGVSKFTHRYSSWTIYDSPHPMGMGLFFNSGCGFYDRICRSVLSIKAFVIVGSETHPQYVQPPVIPGHEFIGEVVKLGPGEQFPHKWAMNSRTSGQTGAR